MTLGPFIEPHDLFLSGVQPASVDEDGVRQGGVYPGWCSHGTQGGVHPGMPWWIQDWP